MVQRIDALFEIERQINGQTADERTHPRRAALLRSEANWMFCLYGRQYRQCEKRGFNDREAAAS
ncbi:hypothetical protein CN081_32270 [Sinorhizobium meliloti]|nr:hypothetical protein CN199_29445 [Sinorhizobium meliloti]RVL13102.1 hypothetical protein CN143_29580 [Sinorhizobium meliloti]RVM21692.1 hypothetical protein CN130_34315 [Sinorhizobium meliloti]RVP30537.1 hypothetical protein CN081_32270 [Sinorhizobium meliloti]RVR04262.1 hypothetical protein CN243_28300 [Sinorhizobium meliloti]